MTTARTEEYVAKARSLVPLIRQHADRAEREARLAHEVVEALHQSGLLRILLPARLGGGDLTIPESSRVMEEVARADGSTGWVYAICSGGPLLGHFVSESAFNQIFGDPRAAIAGSLNPMTCRAEKVDGGYRFSGKATFVSVSPMATWIAVSGLVLTDGSPTFTGGLPLVRSALLPMSKVRIVDNGSVSGMRGTGSHDCDFENVFAPEEFTHEWPNPKTAWREGAYATVPLTTQLGGALASVMLGVAQHSLDAFYELAVSKVPTGTRATLRERAISQVQ